MDMNVNGVKKQKKRVRIMENPEQDPRLKGGAWEDPRFRKKKCKQTLNDKQRLDKFMGIEVVYPTLQEKLTREQLLGPVNVDPQYVNIYNAQIAALEQKNMPPEDKTVEKQKLGAYYTHLFPKQYDLMQMQRGFRKDVMKSWATKREFMMDDHLFQMALLQSLRVQDEVVKSPDIKAKILQAQCKPKSPPRCPSPPKQQAPPTCPAPATRTLPPTRPTGAIPKVRAGPQAISRPSASSTMQPSIVMEKSKVCPPSAVRMTRTATAKEAISGKRMSQLDIEDVMEKRRQLARDPMKLGSGIALPPSAFMGQSQTKGPVAPKDSALSRRQAYVCDNIPEVKMRAPQPPKPPSPKPIESSAFKQRVDYQAPVTCLPKVCGKEVADPKNVKYVKELENLLDDYEGALKKDVKDLEAGYLRIQADYKKQHMQTPPKMARMEVALEVEKKKAQSFACSAMAKRSAYKPDVAPPKLRAPCAPPKPPTPPPPTGLAALEARRKYSQLQRAAASAIPKKPAPCPAAAPPCPAAAAPPVCAEPQRRIPGPPRRPRPTPMAQSLPPAPNPLELRRQYSQQLKASAKPCPPRPSRMPQPSSMQEPPCPSARQKMKEFSLQIQKPQMRKAPCPPPPSAPCPGLAQPCPAEDVCGPPSFKPPPKRRIPAPIQRPEPQISALQKRKEFMSKLARPKAPCPKPRTPSAQVCPPPTASPICPPPGGYSPYFEEALQRERTKYSTMGPRRSDAPCPGMAPEEYMVKRAHERYAQGLEDEYAYGDELFLKTELETELEAAQCMYEDRQKIESKYAQQFDNENIGTIQEGPEEMIQSLHQRYMGPDYVPPDVCPAVNMPEMISRYASQKPPTPVRAPVAPYEYKTPEKVMLPPGQPYPFDDDMEGAVGGAVSVPPPPKMKPKTGLRRPSKSVMIKMPPEPPKPKSTRDIQREYEAKRRQSLLDEAIKKEAAKKIAQEAGEAAPTSGTSISTDPKTPKTAKRPLRLKAPATCKIPEKPKSAHEIRKEFEIKRREEEKKKRESMAMTAKTLPAMPGTSESTSATSLVPSSAVCGTKKKKKFGLPAALVQPPKEDPKEKARKMKEYEEKRKAEVKAKKEAQEKAKAETVALKAKAKAEAEEAERLKKEAHRAKILATTEEDLYAIGDEIKKRIFQVKPMSPRGTPVEKKVILAQRIADRGLVCGEEEEQKVVYDQLLKRAHQQYRCNLAELQKKEACEDVEDEKDFLKLELEATEGFILELPHKQKEAFDDYVTKITAIKQAGEDAEMEKGLLDNEYNAYQQKLIDLEIGVGLPKREITDPPPPEATPAHPTVVNVEDIVKKLREVTFAAKKKPVMKKRISLLTLDQERKKEAEAEKKRIKENLKNILAKQVNLKKVLQKTAIKKKQIELKRPVVEDDRPEEVKNAAKIAEMASKIVLPGQKKTQITDPIRGSALAKERPEDIYKEMILQQAGKDFTFDPSVLEGLIVPSNAPKLPLIGTATEAETNDGVITRVIPTTEINALNEIVNEEVAINLQMTDDIKIPDTGVAKKIIEQKDMNLDFSNREPPGIEHHDYAVTLDSFYIENHFQSRGSVWPKWFPGYFTAFPGENTNVILQKSPSDVLFKAWEMLKPPYVDNCTPTHRRVEVAI